MFWYLSTFNVAYFQKLVVQHFPKDVSFSSSVCSGLWQSFRGSWEAPQRYTLALLTGDDLKPSHKFPTLHTVLDRLPQWYKDQMKLATSETQQKTSVHQPTSSWAYRFAQKCHKMSSGAITPFPLTGKSRNGAHFIKRHSMQLMTFKGRFW